MKEKLSFPPETYFWSYFYGTETRHHQPPPPAAAFLNCRKTLLLLSQTGLQTDLGEEATETAFYIYITPPFEFFPTGKNI